MKSDVVRCARNKRASVLTALLATFVASGCAEATSPAWRTECVGYYTMQIPGDIEYAVQQQPLERGWLPKFSTGLGVFKTSFSVGLDSEGTDLGDIEISSEATQQELDALAKARNNELQKFKNDRLSMADGIDDRPVQQKRLRKEAAEVQFYAPFNGGSVSARYGETGVSVDALVGDRIVSTGLKLTGTPQQTIDAFLKRYRARAPFDVPTEPGVCFPYSFVTGEKEPASVGISMRLRDRPDIVIYLHDGKDFTRLEPPKSAKAYLSKAVQGFFYGAKLANPLDGDLMPFRAITIDEREGQGGFALVTRDSDPGPEAINNAVNKDQDWAYLAYVPADKAAPPGMSSDLVFKVERFGRFAKQPMTEKEFRELVKTLAAGIRRRPGAWVPR